MSSHLQDARLRFVGLHYETSLYELHGPQLTNRYYMVQLVQGVLRLVPQLVVSIPP